MGQLEASLQAEQKKNEELEKTYKNTRIVADLIPDAANSMVFTVAVAVTVTATATVDAAVAASSAHLLRYREASDNQRPGPRESHSGLFL
jgi:hypothetical protein